jgi:tRNA pseudouridine38-40 synthase
MSDLFVSMNYKIIVAYDGTGYAGWQRQQEMRTVAGALEHTFQKVFGHEIKLRAASRTDAGVHARGQVAAFETPLEINPHKMLVAWNGKLPAGITIRSIEPCEETFNPRYHVAQKTYHYNFFLEHPLPFHERYGWHVRHKVDLQKLHACLQVFVGTHNFSSFATIDGTKNPVRTIHEITVSYDENTRMHTITIKGPSFLRFMIRRIVGACIDTASRSHIPVSFLSDKLAEINPKQRLFRAPAHGLILDSIEYKR